MNQLSLMVLPLLLTGIAAKGAGQDWKEFRGANGDGESSFSNVPLNWSDDSGNIEWKSDLPGLGWSSPTVSEGKIWLTTSIIETGELKVLSVDIQTGKILQDITVFKTKLGSIHKKNSHASPTAIIDGDLVFVHFGEHGTACLNQSGELKWQRRFSYGHAHGPGGSPVLFQNKLIISCDGGQSQFIVAVDKVTGKDLWKTPKKHIHPDRFSGGKMKPIAFSTPTLRRVGDTMEVVCAGADHIAGFDVDTGKENWWASYDGYSVVPRPVFHKDMVFYSSSYNSSVLYGLKLGGAGDLTPQVVWESRKAAPHNPTPIVVGDEIYSVSDRGIAQCIDAQTGEVHWQKRLSKAYSASPVVVNQRIYFQDETGGTIVLAAGTAGKELARNKISGRTLATPVPIQDGLLIRTDTALLRIGGDR